MIDVFCFASKNQENIWAGYGAKRWAVSDCPTTEMEKRKTKSLNFPVGAFGLIYCSAEPKFFTMPFKVASEVEWRMEDKIWAIPWAMPFAIEPLGSPKFRMLNKDAFKQLECLKGENNITKAFFVGASCAFAASQIPDEDWQTILDDLGQF